MLCISLEREGITWMNCYECGRDTLIDGYILRVTNTRGDTFFVKPCIKECIEYMEKSGVSLQEYRIEVMAYEG